MHDRLEVWQKLHDNIKLCSIFDSLRRLEDWGGRRANATSKNPWEGLHLRGGKHYKKWKWIKNNIIIIIIKRAHACTYTLCIDTPARHNSDTVYEYKLTATLVWKKEQWTGRRRLFLLPSNMHWINEEECNSLLLPFVVSRKAAN